MANGYSERIDSQTFRQGRARSDHPTWSSSHDRARRSEHPLLERLVFETLNMIQTGKVKPVPVLLFGRAYWKRIVEFDTLVEEGTIDSRDIDLFRYVETAEEAWGLIRSFYDNRCAA